MERIHYLDNLRALAMLAGVFFHAGLAYAPSMHAHWPAADPRGQSTWIDAAVWFPHLFRMPLFFVTAGFFAAMLVKKRGIGGMCKNRLKRILLPLLLFGPLLVICMGLLTREAASTVRHPGPVLAYLKQHDIQMPPTLGHLWFLAYLLWFYLLVWIARASEFKFAAPALSPGRLVMAGPMLLVPALWSVSSPFPAPEALLPQLWALVFFGSYFAFGYWLFDHPEFQMPRPMPLLIGAAVFYGALCWLWGRRNPSLHGTQAIFEAYIGAWMTLACLSSAQTWMNATNRWLRYIADASYWIYVTHLPILLAIQYRLLDLDAAWPLKFAAAVLGTLAVSCVTRAILKGCLGKIGMSNAMRPAMATFGTSAADSSTGSTLRQGS